MAVLFAASPALAAEMPCDLLRGELRALAAAHPEVTEDTGYGEFITKVIGPKTSDSRGVDVSARTDDHWCDGIRTWLRQEGYDTQAADRLEGSDSVCLNSMSMRLQDEREHGGFVAIEGGAGSAHCTFFQIIAFENGKPELGAGEDAGCAPARFLILRIGDTSFPGIIAPEVVPPKLGYQLDLFSGGADGAKICTVILRYQPQFRVTHWFGAKGEGDTDPALRSIIEPILEELAAGRDAAALTAPYLDHARGDSPWDKALIGYPKEGIGPIRYPNNNYDYSLPSGVPFRSEDYAMSYGSLGSEDRIPLFINGRRLLLVFGYPFVPGTAPFEPGFGLFEWKDRDFDAVAGGIIGTTGINPTIE